MTERSFTVSDPRTNAEAPDTMDEAEFRQTYPFLVDVIDQEGFRQAIIVTVDKRIEVNERFATPDQHDLPQ